MVEAILKPMGDETRDVLRRGRCGVVEKIEFVQIAVVEQLHDVAYVPFDDAEIEEHAAVIEGLAGHTDLDLPVVARADSRTFPPTMASRWAAANAVVTFSSNMSRSGCAAADKFQVRRPPRLVNSVAQRLRLASSQDAMARSAESSVSWRSSRRL